MHALDIIQEEHRNLWRIATTMDWVAGELQAGEPVDEGFFHALFDYIQEFMDGCHHAKEDQYLFLAMRRRAPEAATPILDALEKEHRQGPASLQNLRLFLGREGRLADQPEFIEGLRRYASMLKQHIRTEEKDAFPLAREVLRSEDWAGIAAAFSDHHDPLFGEQARAEYRELYHRIVSLAPDAIGLGGSQAGGFRHLGPTTPRKPRPLLEVQDLESCYGRIQALKGISLEVFKGELVALVGANGAGKTTFLRTLSGIQPMSAGQIRFEGKDLSRVRADRRVRAGICHSPEGRQVFGPLSIEDNLRLGAYLRPAGRVGEDLERVYEMFPVLREKRHLPAGTLSGGQQQMLAISRALMGRPRLLLLDEPSMGLAPLLVEEVFNVIRTLKAQGITILLVEQNAFAALGIADRAYVLETGSIVLSGTGQDMIQNEQVRAAYLGM